MSSTTEDIIADLEIPGEIDTLDHKEFEDKGRMKELFDVMKTGEQPLNKKIINPTNDQIHSIHDKLREKNQKIAAYVVLEIGQNLLKHSKQLPESNILTIKETKEDNKEYMIIQTENFFEDKGYNDISDLKEKIDKIDKITNQEKSSEEIQEELNNYFKDRLENGEVTKGGGGGVGFIDMARKIYKIEPQKKIFEIESITKNGTSNLKISVKIPKEKEKEKEKEKPKQKKEKIEEIQVPEKDKLSEKKKELLKELEGDMILSINNVQALKNQLGKEKAESLLKGEKPTYKNQIEVGLIDEFLEKVGAFNKNSKSEFYEKNTSRPAINNTAAIVLENIAKHGMITKPSVFQIKEYKKQNGFVNKIITMNYFNDEDRKIENKLKEELEECNNTITKKEGKNGEARGFLEIAEKIKELGTEDEKPFNYRFEKQKDGTTKFKLIINIPTQESLKTTKKKREIEEKTRREQIS